MKVKISMKKFYLLTVTLSVFFLSNINAQQLYFPPSGDTWETIDPSELNWCQDRIDSLYRMLDEKHTKAFVVLKNGKIVLEKYFDSFTKDSVWYWASAGKSLSAFLVGLAQEDGSLDIQDPVSDYLGNGWTSCTPEQEENIKIWHQLTMTTGLDERGVDPDCLDPNCLKYRTDPGTRWYYHNAPYRLVQDVVANATGMSFQQFKNQKLLRSTGISGLWFNYVYFSDIRSMARFGLLMLAGGDWDGSEIMKDKDFFTDMITTSQSHNKAYGYLWWLNGKEDYQLPGLPITLNGKIIESAPDDMYAALGKNDQKIYVVPSQGLVIVRMGNKAGDIPIYSVSSFDDILWKYINELECQPTSTVLQARQTIKVFPTITTGSVYIKGAPENSEWQLISMYGDLISSGSVSSGQVELGADIPGIYFLRVMNDRHRMISQKKIVVSF